MFIEFKVKDMVHRSSGFRGCMLLNIKCKALKTTTVKHGYARTKTSSLRKKVTTK